MKMDENTSIRQQSFLKGAAILAAASIFAKIVTAVYKFPIFNILDDAGVGFFQATYSVYALILTIATFGIPAALSRLISSAGAKSQTGLVKRYFAASLPGFAIIGFVAMLVMFFLADIFAILIQSPPAAAGIRILAPAVFFVCIIAVFRGYTQGFRDMVPTAVSQIVEVICKALFGISIALWLTSMNVESQIVSAGALTGVTIGLGLCVPILAVYKRRFDKKLPKEELTSELPGRLSAFSKVLKVSIPITIGASFMSIMSFIDTIIVMGRLQGALGYTVIEASAQLGIFARGLTVYNLPSAFIVPIAISVIPTIAALISKGKEKAPEARRIMQSAIKLVVLIALPAAVGIMVLASPIMIVLYQDPREITSTVLTILGAASFFVCFQLITTAILQANGFERIALMTFPAGVLVKTAISLILVSNPDFGIIGSAIGTLACFVVIAVLNMVFIFAKVKDRPGLKGIFLKPAICSIIMAAAAFFSFRLFILLDSVFFARGRIIIDELATGAVSSGDRVTIFIYMVFSIIIAVIIYGVSAILTRAVTLEDMKLVPKGERLARVFKIKSAVNTLK